jgi:hypothetical protein
MARGRSGLRPGSAVLGSYCLAEWPLQCPQWSPQWVSTVSKYRIVIGTNGFVASGPAALNFSGCWPGRFRQVIVRLPEAITFSLGIAGNLTLQAEDPINRVGRLSGYVPAEGCAEFYASLGIHRLG